MFARFTTVITILFFAMLAAASAIPRGGTPPPPPPPPTDQCNSGTVQCCDSTQQAGDPSVKAIAGLLGVDLGSIQGLVGLTCVPVVGGTSCSQQTVCCTGDNFKGLVVIGCTPINVNL